MVYMIAQGIHTFTRCVTDHEVVGQTADAKYAGERRRSIQDITVVPAERDNKVALVDALLGRDVYIGPY